MVNVTVSPTVWDWLAGAFENSWSNVTCASPVPDEYVHPASQVPLACRVLVCDPEEPTVAVTTACQEAPAGIVMAGVQVITLLLTTGELVSAPTLPFPALIPLNPLPRTSVITTFVAVTSPVLVTVAVHWMLSPESALRVDGDRVATRDG